MERQQLLQRFYKAEAGLEIDKTVFEGIDDLFIQLFTAAKGESGDVELFSLNDCPCSSKGHREVKAAVDRPENKYCQ